MEAAVVLLADQPLLPAQIINQVIGVYRRKRNEGARCDYVAAEWQGIPRPPVLFAREMFPSLKALRGDEGARKLLREGAIGPVNYILFHVMLK